MYLKCITILHKSLKAHVQMKKKKNALHRLMNSYHGPLDNKLVIAHFKE